MFAKFEDLLEGAVFRSRWLLAPLYVGLALSLGVLAIKFVQEFLHIIPGILAAKETDLVLSILSLVDIALVGNLVLMVVFAGYENFVSKIDVANHPDRPSWMGKVDMSGLKIRLIASIVAISSIQILKQFMRVTEGPLSDAGERQLFWLVTIHLVLVVSGLLLALMDRIAGKH
ncbi:MAG TPA: TIGR00645 family protein [Alphaproteobacteria bacterium]|nr:TIGR00645 family protein [Alphaproteobacteria bacterium]